MREGLRHGSETDFPLAVAVGHEMYYPCSGFERADVYGVVASFEVPPSAWMIYCPPTGPRLAGVSLIPNPSAASCKRSRTRVSLLHGSTISPVYRQQRDYVARGE
jgi:hypothetical protein